MASSSPSSPISTVDLTSRLQSWLFESGMFDDMVQFARARAAAVPADALSSKGEMRLAFTALHAEFEAFFDSKLEKFCLDAGATAEQVHAQLAAAMAAGEGGSAELVNYITALADFDGAHARVRAPRRRRHPRMGGGRACDTAPSAGRSYQHCSHRPPCAPPADCFPGLAVRPPTPPAVFMQMMTDVRRQVDAEAAASAASAAGGAAAAPAAGADAAATAATEPAPLPASTDGAGAV